MITEAHQISAESLSTENEVRIIITFDLKKRAITVDFGTPPKWMGLDTNKSLEIGEIILNKLGLDKLN
jgi:hypothetical protein